MRTLPASTTPSDGTMLHSAMSARSTFAGRGEACVPVAPMHTPRNTAVVIKTVLVMDAQCSPPATRALAGSRDHPPPSARDTSPPRPSKRIQRARLSLSKRLDERLDFRFSPCSSLFRVTLLSKKCGRKLRSPAAHGGRDEQAKVWSRAAAMSGICNGRFSGCAASAPLASEHRQKPTIQGSYT